MAKPDIPRVLIDSSALLAVIKNEPESRRLDGLLRMIDDDEAMLVESVIVLGEVFKISESAGVSDSAERERKLEAIRSLIQSRRVLLQDVSLPIINKATEYRLSQKMR